MRKRVLSLLLALVLVVGLLPSVALADGAAETASPFKAFELRAGNTLVRMNVDSPQWDTGGFSADKLEYSFTAPLQVWGMGQRLVSATPTSQTAKVTAQVGNGQIVEVRQYLTKLEDLTYGENDVKVTVTDGDDSITYTFHVYCPPRSGINNVTDANETWYYIYSQNAKNDDYAVWDVASDRHDDYYIFVNESVKELIFTYGADEKSYTVLFNGVEATGGQATVPVSGVNEVKVRTETNDKKYSSEYTFHITWLASLNQSFDVPDGTRVCVWNEYHRYMAVKEGDPHTFVGLTEGETYTYAAIKDGCVTVKNTFVAAANSQPIKIAALEPIPASTHTNYSGEWTNFRGSDDNMAIRSATTPTTLKETDLKWAVRMGKTKWTSPTPPIILNDMDVDGVKHDVLICAMAKNIYLLDKETGEVLKSARMNDTAGFATNPLTYAEGMVFVQLDNQIQAFDAATLESVWLSEKIGGQTISPITYYNGYIYIGTWNGESTSGTFACFPVADEKPDQTDEIKYAKWTVSHKGGFYWAGAYATDNYVVFGSDDGTGEGDYTANAILYSVDPNTGAIIDTIAGIKGDIRSTVAYYEGACYAVTKGGLFLKAPISADGHFDHDAFQTVDMGNMCTSTPIIYKGKAFIGTSGASQFSSPGALNIIDVNTMQLVQGITLPGYPQAPMLMSTAYEQAEGLVYIYTTYNAFPGGLYCVTWDTKADTFAVEHIYVPDSDKRQYCLGSPICDSEGTIYYKNDSGYLFALQALHPEADAVAALIDAIGEVTKESEDAIAAAGEAYDALTARQKLFVTNYETLVAAQRKLHLLTTGTSKVQQPAKGSSRQDAANEAETDGGFRDVRSSDWFADAVDYVSENGLMTGTSSSQFSPNADTTRGMIVTILARLSGEDTAKSSPWYEAGRQWAMKNGISDGTNMTAPITREQLAAMLFRCAAANGMDAVTLEENLSGFADADKVSSWAISAMNWAVGQGLIQGANGRLTPQASATRAQVAAILMRFAEKFAK